MRRHNLTLALGVVLEAAEPVSRTHIAGTTGLTKATASTLADALVSGGLLSEVALPPTARSGRPATGLVLSPQSPAGLGIALDIDHLAIAVVDLAGVVLAREVFPGDLRRAAPAEVVASAARAAVAVTDRFGLRLCGATVAVPGLVDPGGERLLRAPNLGWRNVPVLELLRREPRLAALPLRLDNEADLATLAEATHTDGDFVYLSGEVGIGAGIVLDGQLHRGAHGWSGELGHLTVDRRGPVCSCGARGCLEQYAGQEALLRRAGLPLVPSSGLVDDSAVRRLVGQAGAARRPALRALDEAGHALGVVLAGVVNLLDVDELVLGGSLAPLTPWLLPAIEAELRARVLWSELRLPVVRAARSGPDAVVVGAAMSATKPVTSDPAAWLQTAPVLRDQIVSK